MMSRRLRVRRRLASAVAFGACIRGVNTSGRGRRQPIGRLDHDEGESTAWVGAIHPERFGQRQSVLVVHGVLRIPNPPLHAIDLPARRPPSARPPEFVSTCPYRPDAAPTYSEMSAELVGE
jgi:hypothetical protein